MKFDTLKKSHKKGIIIGVSVFAVIALVLIVSESFAKYSLVKSIPIVNGAINYKVPDFKIMAMYVQKDDSYCTEDNCYNVLEEGVRMPSSGYSINESKSYCTIDNQNKDANVKIYTDDNGNHIFKNLAKSDKCYLYFDKYMPQVKNIILSNVKLNNGTPNFRKISTTNEGLYIAKDNDGDSYYFRGAITDNYVKFANFYWRIIRINGDGTIRLIYDGTEAHDNDLSTQDSIALVDQAFNSTFNDNAYVGFKYTVGQLRGLGTKSDILQQLEVWYQNNLSSYANKIDTNAGFCGDKTPYTNVYGTASGGGTGTTATYYGAYIRLITNKTPELKCGNVNDLYTTSSSNKGNKSLSYPIGLISADEIMMAGGITGTSEATNEKYYLYNGQNYWTMTPHSFSSHAFLFSSRQYGNLQPLNTNTIAGIRPVINLRADVTLTGNGTMFKPYIVS